MHIPKLAQISNRKILQNHKIVQVELVLDQ